MTPPMASTTRLFHLLASATLATLLIPATRASATTLLPGQQPTLVDTIADTDPSLSGTLLQSDTLTSTKSSDPGPNLTAKILRRADTGTLDFYYLVGTGTAPNSALTITGFADATTAVYEFATPGHITLPISAGRSNAPGDAITFYTALGSNTAFLIRTAATAPPPLETLSYVQGSDIAGIPNRTAIYLFQPTDAPGVPEPLTGILLLLGAAGLTLRFPRGLRS